MRFSLGFKVAKSIQLMCMKKTTNAKLFNLIHYTWTLFGLWTVLVITLLGLEYIETQDSAVEVAVNTARAHLDKDKSFRFWGALHGGVYVPVREDTPPNPYLSGIKERDIETESGLKLTLLNPEYMLRHLNETFSKLYGIAGHITSLNPLRPENRPDAWEIIALNKFSNGADEVMEIITPSGESPSLRLMQPLYVKPECLWWNDLSGQHIEEGNNVFYLFTNLRGISS